MVSSPKGISVINQGDKIAKILVIPSEHDKYLAKRNKRNKLGFGSTGEPMTMVVLDLNTRPMYTIRINDKLFNELLDTGADLSIITLTQWPKDWPLQKADQTLPGLGVASNPLRTAQLLKWTDIEGNYSTF